jgi:hypothetical protein
MDEIFCIDDFFSESDMAQIESSVRLGEPGKDVVVPHGPFAGKLISNYIFLKDDKILISALTDKISKVLPDHFNIISLTRVKLFLPWDIHSDYFKNECRDNHLPYYNFLIPLDDVNSRTVIFDQTTNDSPDFYLYKMNNQPIDNPVDQEFWNENLSMCWPHDRPYVSLRAWLPSQRRGQLLGFPSKYFHSSDNFHTKFSEPKSFIQIRTEYQPNA